MKSKPRIIHKIRLKTLGLSMAMLVISIYFGINLLVLVPFTVLFGQVLFPMYYLIKSGVWASGVFVVQGKLYGENTVYFTDGTSESSERRVFYVVTDLVISLGIIIAFLALTFL